MNDPPPAFNPGAMNDDEIVISPLLDHDAQQQAQQQQQQQQGQFNPSQDELREGLPTLPAIIETPHEPTVVSSPKDGVGIIQGCMQNMNLISWILTLSLWYSILSGILCEILDPFAIDGYCGFFTNLAAFLGVTGGILVIYLIECFCSGTNKYLSNILQKEGASDFVERIKSEPAVIWWRIACYHWEIRRRRRTVRDSNGNTRTEWESYREKVYTWRARQQYLYATCVDVSGDLIGLDEYKLTKLKFNKTYGFLDTESQQHYSMQLQNFRMLNWRDVHQEFYEEYSINGYIDRILAESEPGIKPYWMTNGMFWVYNLFGLSPCFRTMMTAKCGKVKYTFIKQISSKRLQQI